MWNLTINGTDLYHILNWFFIYSFLGWVWETFYVSTKHGEFVNRGFVSGPFLYNLWLWGNICLSDSEADRKSCAAFVLRGHCGCHSAGIYYGGSDGEYFSYLLVGLQ